MPPRLKKKTENNVSAHGEINPPMSLAEAGAEVDADLDEGDADLEAVREAGAVSAESLTLNAQTREVISGKRDKNRRIRWNDDNAQVVYDSIRQAGWNISSSYIMCRRVTGEPAQWSTACAAVPNGLALLDWVGTKCHKINSAQTYEIRVIDSHTNMERGRGKLFMPDTLGDTPATQPPQPQPNPYAQFAPPPSYPQHPGLNEGNHYRQPPPGWYPGMPSPPQAAPAPAAAPAAPQAPPAPTQASGEVADLRAQVGFLSGQLSQLLERVGMPAPQAPAPQITVVGPPAAAQPAPGTPPPAAQPAPAPQASQPSAPPGLVHVPGMGYIQSELVASALMATMRGRFDPPAPPAPRPMPPPSPPAPAPTGPLGGLSLPPEPPPSIASMMNTHARNMRDTAGGLAAMVKAADEIRSVLAPEKSEEAPAAASVQSNGDPIKKPFEVLDAGPVRIPFDPETGDMKGFANLLMINADKIGNFAGKLYEKAAMAAAQAAAAQNTAQGGKTLAPPPSLPNGVASPGWPPAPTLPRA